MTVASVMLSRSVIVTSVVRICWPSFTARSIGPPWPPAVTPTGRMPETNGPSSSPVSTVATVTATPTTPIRRA